MRETCEALVLKFPDGTSESIVKQIAIEAMQNDPDFQDSSQCGKAAVDSYPVRRLARGPDVVRPYKLVDASIHLCAEHWDQHLKECADANEENACDTQCPR